MSTLRFLKGHGTENDFVIVPDPDGALDLSAARVAALCDRRAGIGADGMLRVVRSAKDPAAAHMAGEAEWFMDYRNADGSIAEMCGNGARVFARYLVESGEAAPGDLRIATRGGVRAVHVPEGGGDVTVGMGAARLPGPDGIAVTLPDGSVHAAVNVNMGNPHAVVFVADLDDAGDLLTAPAIAPATAYPEGANVEFVVDRAPRHVAMRVHERGSGETRSCGTGACAVMVASARRDAAALPATYTVDVPGGRLVITEHPDGAVDMTGPAVILAEGEVDLDRLPAGHA
ncbi:diaminopimelate epimerase [Yinghuangia sp. ASG 101]|uniref:diaminopimelate epimerase n=1 Tax=Yinghuangia sp. ASG 101 TaxID=2896848 RepID=UPI001E4F62B7|nr:diaminopimelate epimerase [Yinghuangia sp. ASG 101]UGQ13912.1 diaminopimelate epimerase [Yinghuangia sp. ASG 101]